MSYKYKDEILEDIGPEPNANFDIESERYYQKLEELDEVYRKAEAWDKAKEVITSKIKTYKRISDKDDDIMANHIANSLKNILDVASPD